MDYKVDISAGLKYARNKLGLTREQMAELLNVSKETIANYENNKTLPDIITVVKLAYACECQVEDILHYGNSNIIEEGKDIELIKEFRNICLSDLPLVKKKSVVSIDDGFAKEIFYDYIDNMLSGIKSRTDIMDISDLNKKELVELIKNPPENLQADALKARKIYYGNRIFVRGLIEFTNHCKNNCMYCGLRCENKKVVRYRMTKEEILECCRKGAKKGFSTFVLQGGEDVHFTTKEICDIVYSIKNLYPEIAVTLSIGEKSKEAYKSFRNAGADRYLLRHETANDEHYSKLHPEKMKLSKRKKCLYTLKELGYQTGAGFMVGSPYQSYETLAEDLLFLKELQPEMVGIGPFIPHSDTPFADFACGNIDLTLTMISLTRLLLPESLLPATTALATLDKKNGRKLGIMAGANVVMPNLTPGHYGKNYSIYNKKASSGNENAVNIEHLEEELNTIGFALDMSRGDHCMFN